MANTGYTALVLGSTGLIGGFVVRFLLDNDAYSVVYAVSRKPLAIKHNKLINILADADSIAQHIQQLRVDHLYSCLGSTKKKTPRSVDYYGVDYDYLIKSAHLLINNKLKSISFVSSMGANESSSNSYLKMKGEIERDVISCKIPTTLIFRPSLLLGKREEGRILEKMSGFFVTIFGFLFIGKLKNYKNIRGETVAKAMINATVSKKEGVHIFQNQTIKKLA